MSHSWCARCATRNKVCSRRVACEDRTHAVQQVEAVAAADPARGDASRRRDTGTPDWHQERVRNQARCPRTDTAPTPPQATLETRGTRQNFLFWNAHIAHQE